MPAPAILNQESAGIDLAELRRQPPALLIAEALENFAFDNCRFERRSRYLLSPGAYEALNDGGRRHHGKPVFRPGAPKFPAVYRPYRGEGLKGKAILFLRHGGCGDLLFLNPLLRHIKERWPTCRLKLACGRPYQSMLAGWPWIDEVLPMPLALAHVLEADYHACFEGVIEHTQEARTTNAYELMRHWVNLPIPAAELRPRQEPGAYEVEAARAVLARWGLAGGDFILVQMRASSPLRSPSEEFWKKLLLRLMDKGHRLVLTDEPRQAEAISKFLVGLGSRPKCDIGIYNYAPFSSSFAVAVAVASLSRLVLGCDSALLHIGASVGRKVFGIYGPFLGHLRLGTYPEADWVDAPADCAPCFTHGHEPCPNAANQCFDNLDLAEVSARIGELYGGDRKAKRSPDHPTFGGKMKKINLKNTTLIAVDCLNVERAVRVLRTCMEYADFAEARLLTSRPGNISENIRMDIIKPLTSLEQVSHFMLKELSRHVETEFCLNVQHDGFIINPGAWTEEFLQYDYIGAPWWYTDGFNVGNGGFSLRSKKLLDLCARFDLFSYHPEDDRICRIYRPIFEGGFGIKYAPEALAERFSWEENGLHPKYRGSFGFHGPAGLEMLRRGSLEPNGA